MGLLKVTHIFLVQIKERDFHNSLKKEIIQIVHCSYNTNPSRGSSSGEHPTNK